MASANSPMMMNFPTGDEAGWAAGLKESGLLRGAGGVHDAPDRDRKAHQQKQENQSEVVRRLAGLGDLLERFRINRTRQHDSQRNNPDEKARPFSPLAIIELAQARQQTRQEPRHQWVPCVPGRHGIRPYRLLLDSHFSITVLSSGVRRVRL